MGRTALARSSGTLRASAAVILSEAKDLLLFVFDEKQQLLRGVYR